ncbi:MAG: glucosaminidase domain-containing protein [Flavobacteriaceae bacterium]|nr:glucosaminidase domain-containing protein [Flavobacteriaceae bacterium]MCY4217427.1 glucosaminidase domain-containing protein [Flavobacteriaceae bacterium]
MRKLKIMWTSWFGNYLLQQKTIKSMAHIKTQPLGYILLTMFLLSSCGSSLKTLERKKEELRKAQESVEKIESRISKMESKIQYKKPQKTIVKKGTREELIQDYIKKYSKLAVSEMKKYRIPASIKLAQGILETKYDTSRLATEGNNHFGIKCHKGWKGTSMRVTDDAPNECFRTYRTASESFRDHSLFLNSRPRYDALFDLKLHDYSGWAHGLKKAGYATNPLYAEGLIALIEEFKLYRFDKGGRLAKQSKSDKNQLVHRVQRGDTLYSISKRYKVKVSDLIHKNNINGSLIIPGQRLIIR